MRPLIITETRNLSLLAAPLILAQLAQTSMGFVDTVMVGRLGNEALAGIALGNTLFFLVLLLGMGIVLAVGPMVSQAHGAGDDAAVGRAVRQGLWLATGISVLAMFIFWNLKPLLLLMGQDPATVELAMSYLRAISWGFLPSMWLTALRSMLESLSQPRPILLITIIGVGLNIFANNVLMFGKLGFPALGLVGTGYASTIVYWVMFLLSVLYVQRFLGSYQVFSRLRTPDVKTLRELFSIGWPIGLTLGFEVGLFSATALLMGLLGAVQLAAHQIALQSASVTFMVPLGLATATSVRVGQALGRRDKQAARLSGYVGIGLSAVFMSMTALAFILLPKAIISLYVDVADPSNRRVLELAVVYLAIAGLFQIFDGLQVSASGALRGFKDTRMPMIISFIAYWGVGLSSGIYLTFSLGWGGRGLWLGLVLGLSTAAALLVWRFVRMASRKRLATA